LSQLILDRYPCLCIWSWGSGVFRCGN